MAETKRAELVGRVVSDANDKTITVLVDLVDTIYESGIQYYSKCKGYEPKISNKTRVDYMINNNKTT